MGDEVRKQLLITLAALGMILDGEGERMIAEAHLLDDVVRSAPGFDLETFAEFIERLVMRAIHLFQPMRGGAIRSQRLDIVIFHFRRVVAGNIEVQSAAERDIEELHAFADGENRQLPFQRVLRCRKFPAIAFRLHVRIQNRRIWHRLMEELWRHIWPAAQKQAVHFLERHFLGPGVPKAHIGMFGESATKPFVVLLANPGGHVRHGPTFRPFISVVNSSPANHGR